MCMDYELVCIMTCNCIYTHTCMHAYAHTNTSVLSISIYRLHMSKLYQTTSTHLFYCQWSWCSHSEIRGPILTPAAACKSSIVIGPFGPVYTLSARWWSPEGLARFQQRHKTSVCQVTPSVAYQTYKIQS